MLPFIGKEPVVVASAVRAVLHACVLVGVLTLDAEALAAISIAVEAVLVVFTRQNVTPTANATLPANTEVHVEHTNDTVIIQPTPPGPVGIEDAGAP